MLTPDQRNAVDALRYTGLALQLVGVGLAAIGISQVRREWTDRPGVAGALAFQARRLWAALQRADERLRRLLRLRSRRTVHDVNLHASVRTGATLDARVIRQQPPSDGTPEERLAWLEDRVMLTLSETDRLTKEMGTERTARETGDAAERQARTDALSDARAALANFAGGGLRLQTIGVGCLLVGITIATIPDKLAAL